MQAVVVYESMYGNTHSVADAIGRGLRSLGSVLVVPVNEATSELLQTADLVVVGGPTHVHGMTRSRTRKAAIDATRRPGNTLVLDPCSRGPGVRDWLASLTEVRTRAAAFDTRLTGPGVLTGRASKAITRGLRRHGFEVVAKPASFFVDKDNRLREGEEDRAVAWAEELVSRVLSAGFPTGKSDSVRH